MISREKNPDYLNSFLDYMVTIQNKSPNTVKEYTVLSNRHEVWRLF